MTTYIAPNSLTGGQFPDLSFNFPLQFVTDTGQTWGLFNRDGPNPPGMQFFVQENVNGVWSSNIQPVSLTISVPEPETIGMVVTAMLLLLLTLYFSKSTTKKQVVRPQRSLQKRPTVITSKPANGSGRPGLRMFYPAASCGGKSVLVRQLRGPHLSTCP
jgi:hypothetical protein